MAKEVELQPTGRTGDAESARLIKEDKFYFSVDAHLWRQLGELLVTKPSSALAELIKNSYDADATEVVVGVEPGGGYLSVADNGHGMDLADFERYWARLGSTHKEDDRRSRNLNRLMSGSKGIGRISARYLSEVMQIETVSEKFPGKRVIATVDWSKSKQAELLTQTPIEYRHEAAIGGNFQPGTTIRLTKLKHEWNAEGIKQVAGEIWKLQPPFGRMHKTMRDQFTVKLESSQSDLVVAFTEQMEAALNSWEAKIEGTVQEGKVKIRLAFHGEKALQQTFSIGKGQLNHADFEIRIFGLKGKQRTGVPVQQAREYIEEFRGVQVYDAGFRLPHYGSEKEDWLGLTLDQSRRLSKTELIPEELRTDDGLLHLPHVRHLLGVVNVDTAAEKQLKINISRDRLLDSPAFEELRDAVRSAIDWYANEKARRQYDRTSKQAKEQPAPAAVIGVRNVLAEFREHIPPPVYNRLQSAVQSAVSSVKKQEDFRLSQVSILTPLATAGIGAVAYQHELQKQLLAAEGVAERLSKLAASRSPSPEQLNRIADDLLQLVSSMRDVGGLFSHLTEGANLRDVKRLSVAKTVSYALRQLQPQLPGVTFSQEIDPDLVFPPATQAEWMSLLQNVIFNAANAMVSSKTKRLRFEGRRRGRQAELVVMDTGSGVDLNEAERLFKPFERGGDIAPERRAAGFGGTGLGLTIVKMIAEQRAASVGFTKPDSEFSTAFRLSWTVDT